MSYVLAAYGVVVGGVVAYAAWLARTWARASCSPTWRAEPRG